ncbi:FAD-dependent monooxygenase [Microbacterium deminutum]|uniref:FAD-dependent oxidoreductase n=1 Tax=Microbacterium deminutum TaxID=344164 RepID=A0ABP5BEA0_9MICO
MTDDAAAAVPVLIAGGGPVGLTTALELAHHGVAALVIEPREIVEHSRPRAKTTSARSMELFRRTGAAAQIRRRAALPVEWSQAVRFCTTVSGIDIAWFDGVLGLDLVDSDLTSEAAQQVTQPVVEEVLRALIAQHPLASTRFGSRVSGVDLSGPRPRVTVTDAGGAASVIEAEYVVGADGSRSVVREALGAHYEGAAGGRKNVNITFRSSQLAGLLPTRTAVHHWVLNPNAPGVVGPLDLHGTWWAIATGTESVADDAEAARLVRALVGADIDVEVLATDPWQARLLLANSYGSGRTYIVGDAAHQNPPWGGHGFNTGVGDAVNLAWKLGGVINGWAPPALLTSYESERRPVAQQTIDLAVRNMKVLSNDLSSPELLDDSADGARARAAAADAVDTFKRAEFFSLGLVLGYGYGSDAAAQAPASDVYRPIPRPGNRLPHSRNDSGGSLYDLLGQEFTVLGGDAHAWTDAAARRGVPLVHVDPAAHGFAPVAGDEVVLVRPDQHIAWVGSASADPSAALDDALRGLPASAH